MTLTPIDFTGQVQTAGLCTNDVHSKSFYLFAWMLPNWYSGQRSNSILSVVYSIYFDPLLDNCKTTCSYTGWLERVDCIYCMLFGSQDQVKILVFISALSAQYFIKHLLNNYQTWYRGCQLRVDNSLYICNPSELCTRGHLCFLSISCYYFIVLFDSIEVQVY